MTPNEYQDIQSQATDAFYNAVEAWQKLKEEQTGRKDNFRPIAIFKIIEIAVADKEDVVEAMRIFEQFYPTKRCLCR